MDHLSYNATGDGRGEGGDNGQLPKQNSCLTFLEEENTLQGGTV